MKPIKKINVAKERSVLVYLISVYEKSGSEGSGFNIFTKSNEK